MKMRTGGLIIVGLLLAGLYIFNRKDVEVVSMKPFVVNPISASGGELKGIIVLNNPNLLSSTIRAVHEKFYLNGILLGILDNQLDQGIPGMKETEFPVSIRFSNTDYQNALAVDTAHHSDIAVMVTGDIEFQNLFKSGKTTVQQSAAITHEKP